MDENYEWDSEFALESDLLDALQLYRSGHPKRPVSTIAAQELEKQSEHGRVSGLGAQGNVQWFHGRGSELHGKLSCTKSDHWPTSVYIVMLGLAQFHHTFHGRCFGVDLIS